MPSHMLAEIYEQPQALSRLLAEGWPQAQQAARAVRQREVRFVLLAARGSSDNAARYGKYAFGARNRLPVGLAAPSLYTVYGAPPRHEGALVIGLSQSGQSPDVAEVVGTAREQGALTVGITNHPDSPLARAAEFLIELRAGPERSIPATKTYTAQLLALAMFSAALAGEPAPPPELLAVPDHLSAALRHEDAVRRAAGDLREVGSMLVIGRGYNFATAFEIALKVQETAYLAALPFSSADFRHGPLSVVEPGLAALVLAPAGRVREELCALARQLDGWGARVLLLSDRPEEGLPALALPPGLPEWLSPFPLTALGQLLAFSLAAARGLDPDHPRRLQKVTATR